MTIAIMTAAKSCFLCFLLFLFVSTAAFSQEPVHYKKSFNSVIIPIPSTSTKAHRCIRLHPVNSSIIHIQSSPTDTFSVSKSLMVETLPVFSNWTVTERNDTVQLQTAILKILVSVQTGNIHFADLNNKLILKAGASQFQPSVVDGNPAWHVQQVFEGTEGEAFYGLGQHQSDIANYKARQVELLQNNTDVAVPFLLSSANYGILWENYSITKVMDVRNRLPLSALKLFSAEGNEGWLTARYVSKKDSSKIYLTRPESAIDYSFLQSLKYLPPSFPPQEGKVLWEGAFESGFTGLHQFYVKYAGYIKVWVDGKLLLDRWRQAWNPGLGVVDLNLQRFKRYQLKIEWIPDGSESYLAIDWLNPVAEADQNKFAFDSECGDQVDYYFISGKHADEVIKGYRQLTGKATMLPKWAFGLWQSRERYKTQEEILTTVKTFRDKRIPLDNIVLDWSYWKEDQWGSQDFDSTRFPDATGLVKTLHDKYNTRFMISVWPKFYEGIGTYKHFNKNGWLYPRNVADKQRDWIGKGYVSTFYDAFNPAARHAFWNLINDKLYSLGVDAWWLDASEPDILSNTNIPHRKALMTPMAIGSAEKYYNAYPLVNAKGIYEGQRQTNPSNRVFILTRSAYAGMQKYAAATWSGDIGARWEDFKAQIAAGIHFSMSGLPYWTSDIGGFAVERRYENATGKDLEEWREQMTRWYQFGAFCPLFRVHGQYPFREIFNVAPETHEAYQSMLYYDKLRYRLMPYIYSLAGYTYENDYTIMRGLVMDFSDDTAVYDIGDQYMFGPSLLVNPVYESGATERRVYLPAGKWFDFYTGESMDGGKYITAHAPYERMPLYVRAGSVIPFGPELQYTSEKPADPITLFVYTGADGSFTLYEDEGVNYNYEKGMKSTITFTYNEKSKTLTLGKRNGSFPQMLMNRQFRIVQVSPGSPATSNPDQKPLHIVKYNGTEKSVRLK